MQVTHRNNVTKNNKQSNDEKDDILKNIMKDDKEVTRPIDDNTLKMIQDDLTHNYSEEVLEALTNFDVRNKLVETVLKEHGNFVKNNREIAEYVVRESIGTGIIEKILTNPKITDIGWNGTQLSIKTNDDDLLIDGKKLNITPEYIERIIAKYAAVNNKAFNSGCPSFDGMFKNVRISAMHKDNSPNGATLSIRVTRPKLALNKDNFKNFAPDYILELFEKIVRTRANICISGETGSGKTELQKLLLSFTDDHERIIMIEDVQETHAKELFPDKDIYSWVTSIKKSIADLVKDSLRNLPTWLIVSETRGEEAYEMLRAVLSGHYVITTLHAVNARAIPRRFVNMCGGLKINEKALESDIYSYFDFGIHVKKMKLNGKTIRYLNEIVEFSEDGGATTVFKQKFLNGRFVIENGVLSDSFKERMSEKFLTFNFPENSPKEIEVK